MQVVYSIYICIYSRFAAQMPVDTSQRIEPGHSISYSDACAPSEDSDQSANPRSLIRVFAVRLKMLWTLGYPHCALRRLITLCGRTGWSEFSLCVLCPVHMKFLSLTFAADLVLHTVAKCKTQLVVIQYLRRYIKIGTLLFMQHLQRSGRLYASSLHRIYVFAFSNVLLSLKFYIIEPQKMMGLFGRALPA